MECYITYIQIKILAGINTKNGNGTIWIEKTKINKSQTEWMTNYPNLVVNVCYTTPNPYDGETIELPELKTYEDYTNIEVLTEVAPSKIEATYYGYTME